VTTFLYVIVPYVCLVLFVGGHVWRYRYDKFGWTTRSSQLYEKRLLRWGSPLFHLGILGVLAGHVVGLVIPESWTSGAGVSEDAYHALSFGLGTVAGLATVVGLAILVYRRRTVGPVFSATTRNDKAMYVVLAGTILAGLVTTVWNNVSGGDPHDYRHTVSPWFRSVFALDPDTALVTAAPWGFRLHAVLAFVLLGMWPFTRLVHMLSAPVGYLTRPYVVYRSRDGRRAPRRGWEPVGKP
jgi:nitrate reductase gamma subunit